MVVVDEFDDVVGVSLSNDVCFHLSILFSSFLLIQHQEWQVCKSDFNSCRRKWKCCCRCRVPNVQNSWIKPDVEPSYRILLHLMTFLKISMIPIWNWTFNVFINTEIDPKKGWTKSIFIAHLQLFLARVRRPQGSKNRKRILRNYFHSIFCAAIYRKPRILMNHFQLCVHNEQNALNSLRVQQLQIAFFLIIFILILHNDDFRRFVLVSKFLFNFSS